MNKREGRDTELTAPLFGRQQNSTSVSFETVNLSQKSSVPTIKIDIGEFSRPLIFMLDTGASVNLVKMSEVSPYVNIDTNHIIILKGITTHAIKTLGRVS